MKRMVADRDRRGDLRGVRRVHTGQRPMRPAPGRRDAVHLRPTRRRRLPVVREISVPDGTALRLDLVDAARFRHQPRRRRGPGDAAPGRHGERRDRPARRHRTHRERHRRRRVGTRKGPRAHRLPVHVASPRQRAARTFKPRVIAHEAEATKGEDAKKIGIGAGIGAAVGAIVGGGDGAAKGAAIGGAGGTGVVLATKGRKCGSARARMSRRASPRR